MKSAIGRFGSLFLLFIGVMGAAPGKKKLTIKDYYFQLPAEAFPFEGASAEARKQFLKVGASPDDQRLIFQVDKVIDDPRNGYLEIQYTSHMGPETVSFAIWRSSAGNDIVGVSTDHGLGAQPKFYSLAGNVWTDATREVFSDFRKEVFKPKKNWPAECGQGGGRAENYAFPVLMHCPLPRQGLDITCTFRFQCLTLGTASVSDLESKYKATDYYAKPTVKFQWKKDRFVAK